MGTVLAGFLLEKVDVRILLVALGVLYMVTILAASLTPAMRSLDKHKLAEPGGEQAA
jgi:hypothetical protein